MAGPFPTPSGVIRARMGFTTGSLEAYFSNFDIGYTGASVTTAQLADLAGDVATSWGTDLAGLFNTLGHLTSVECVDLQNPATVSGVVAVSIAGTRGGTALPENIAVSLVYKPDRRYRGSRPKGFFRMGVAGDLSSTQHWTTDFTGEVNAAWASFIAAVVAGSPSGVTLTAQKYVNYDGPPYSVVSNPNKTRSHSVPTKVDPPGVYAILSVAASLKVASQRKRLGKPF